MCVEGRGSSFACECALSKKGMRQPLGSSRAGRRGCSQGSLKGGEGAASRGGSAFKRCADEQEGKTEAADDNRMCRTTEGVGGWARFWGAGGGGGGRGKGPCCCRNSACT